MLRLQAILLLSLFSASNPFRLHDPRLPVDVPKGDKGLDGRQLQDVTATTSPQNEQQLDAQTNMDSQSVAAPTMSSPVTLFPTPAPSSATADSSQPPTTNSYVPKPHSRSSTGRRLT